MTRIAGGSPALNELLLRLNRSSAVLGPKYRARFRSYWETNTEAMLLDVVNTAVVNVPHYRARHATGKKFVSVGDFKSSFSTIDKDTVLRSLDEFVSENIDHSGYDLCTTGGTSGKPLQLHLPKSRYIHELAALHNIWGRVGYRFSPRAVVRNERLLDRDFIVNPILREYIFDGFRNTDDYLARIYEVMKSRRIGYYHGYTSNAHEFARFLVRERLDYSFIRAFITTSENFYDHQKAAFDALDGVQHVNFYGHSEKLVLAAYCSASGMYHFHQQYGFCELLDDSGGDVTEVGQVGEIVGSTIYNSGMPLLRYRTGDYARYAGNGLCPHCRHDGMSATHIIGRWAGDRIYNADGSFVTTTALNLHSHLYAHIDGIQYVQEHPGELLVTVIPGYGYSEEVASRLHTDVASKLDPSTTVEVRSVDALEKTSNGKFLLLVSKCASPVSRSRP